MNPRLIGIAGPLEGAFFALSEETISIGRDGTNALAIDDPSVSPRHCLIEGRAGTFKLRDTGGLGGTLVNGAPIEEHELLHGDEVRVGDCLFLFLLYQAETPPSLRRHGAPAGPEAALRRRNAAFSLDHDMVGESPAMKSVYRLISKVAPTDSTVLICGESGTGKELAARAIHRNSRRAERPFVAINTAALAETLLESELFGHERGAFTGAVAQKRGKLELASGGTVFLDEIGDMPPPLQVKLLRVLQEQQFERVGGTSTIRVDIRVIAATNKDLCATVRSGGFRQDLYYRLNVVSLRMPPLRERVPDIPLLAGHFIGRYRARNGRRVDGIAPGALARLVRYPWPGNVRELENVIERAVVLGSGSTITEEDLPEALLGSPAAGGVNGGGYRQAVAEAKRQVVLQALAEAGGSYTEAAKRLGLHPNNLHRLVRTLALRQSRRRGGRDEAAASPF